MTVYVESSAAGKLLVAEPQSEALVAYLNGLRAEAIPLVSSWLLETELRRMAIRLDVDQAEVSEILSGFDLVEHDRASFVEAGLLPGRSLRSLDALHIAAALRTDAESMVSYDVRQSEAARMVGLRVITP